MGKASLAKYTENVPDLLDRNGLCLLSLGMSNDAKMYHRIASIFTGANVGETDGGGVGGLSTLYSVHSRSSDDEAK